MEKTKQEKEAHGEIETAHPGYLGAQDTYYVGTIKSIGRIYQQTFIDTYTKVAFAKLYDRKNALVAADMLNDRVLPFFEEQEVSLLRILTDRGTQAKSRDELLVRGDPAFWGEVALSHLPWAPTVDKQTIPEPPIERITAGAAANIDLLVGSNVEETRLFFVVGGSIDQITEGALSATTSAYGLSAEGLSAYCTEHLGASAGELL
jgi:hypothetical protein